MQSAKVGKRGAIVVPAKSAQTFGIEEGKHRDCRGSRRRHLHSPRGRCSPSRRYTPETSRPNSSCGSPSTPPITAKPERKFASWVSIPIRLTHRRPPKMDRLFLDANVLFSAAYRPDARLVRFWKLQRSSVQFSLCPSRRQGFNLPRSKISEARLISTFRIPFISLESVIRAASPPLAISFA